MLKTNQSDQGLAYPSQKDRAEEGPRYSAGKVEVVVEGGQLLVHIPRRRAVGEDVVSGLDVERLFDLGVRGYNEVYDDQSRDRQG